MAFQQWRQVEEELSIAAFPDEDEAILDRVRWMTPALMFFVTFIFGMLPFYFKRIECGTKRKQTMRALAKKWGLAHAAQVILCLLSGILLATIFGCLLPRARSLMKLASLNSPLADLHMCWGFLLTYLFQEIILTYLEHHSYDYDEQYHIYLVQYICTSLRICVRHIEPPKFPSQEELDEDAKSDANLIASDDIIGLKEALKLSAEETKMVQKYIQEHRVEPVKLRVDYLKDVKNFIERNHPKMNATVYIGVLLLCLHCIADGFCVALQDTEELTWYVTLILLLQRVFIAPMISFELVMANLDGGAISLVILLYSATAPIGCMLAILAKNMNVHQETLGIMMAFSAGSLMYMLFLELFRASKAKLAGYGSGLAAFNGFILPIVGYLWRRGQLFTMFHEFVNWLW